jgi:integrase
MFGADRGSTTAPNNTWRMIQRRANDLGTRVKIGCHTFRATGITVYLEAGGCWKTRKPWRRMKARARLSHRRRAHA